MGKHVDGAQQSEYIQWKKQPPVMHDAVAEPDPVRSSRLSEPGGRVRKNRNTRRTQRYPRRDVSLAVFVSKTTVAIPEERVGSE